MAILSQELLINLTQSWGPISLHCQDRPPSSNLLSCVTWLTQEAVSPKEQDNSSPRQQPAVWTYKPPEPPQKISSRLKYFECPETHSFHQAHYVNFAARGPLFKTITKPQLHDAMNKRGIMEVVVFTSTADQQQFDRTRAEIVFMDKQCIQVCLSITVLLHCSFIHIAVLQ